MGQLGRDEKLLRDEIFLLYQVSCYVMSDTFKWIGLQFHN